MVPNVAIMKPVIHFQTPNPMPIAVAMTRNLILFYRKQLFKSCWGNNLLVILLLLSLSGGLGDTYYDTLAWMFVEIHVQMAKTYGPNHAGRTG